MPRSRAVATMDAPDDRGMGEVNYRLPCHPVRCGTVHLIGRPRLTRAMQLAVDRDRLIVGDGPFARQNGGPDL